MEALSTQTLIILFLLMLWTLPWKGVALWMAARRNHYTWFIILLIVNTVALLEIIYIFHFARQYSVSVEEDSPTTKDDRINPEK